MATIDNRWKWVVRQLPFLAYVLGILVLLGVGTGWLLLGTLRSVLGQRVDIDGDYFASEDPVYGFRFRENASARFRDPGASLDFGIATDGNALRVHASGDRVEAPVDVLFVGGSFIFAWGVEARESMSERLAQLSDLTVANAGTPSVGTQSAAAAVRRLAHLQPRYVVYGFIDDHVRRNTCPCALTPTPFCQAIPYVRAEEDGTLAELPPVHSFFNPTGGMRNAYLASQGELGFWRSQYWIFRATLGFVHRRSELPCSRDSSVMLGALDISLDRLSADTRAAGAKLVVAYLPQLGGIQSWTLAPPGRIAARTDLTFVDTTPWILDYMRAKRLTDQRSLLLPDLAHPTREAQEIFGRALCVAFADFGEVELDRCFDPLPNHARPEM